MFVIVKDREVIATTDSGAQATELLRNYRADYIGASMPGEHITDFARRAGLTVRAWVFAQAPETLRAADEAPAAPVAHVHSLSYAHSSSMGNGRERGTCHGCGARIVRVIAEGMTSSRNPVRWVLAEGFIPVSLVKAPAPVPATPAVCLVKATVTVDFHVSGDTRVTYLGIPAMFAELRTVLTAPEPFLPSDVAWDAVGVTLTYGRSNTRSGATARYRLPAPYGI